MSGTTAAPVTDTTSAPAAPPTQAPTDTTTATTILTPDTSKQADTTTTTPTPQKWPDDWRAQVASNDEKEAKRLERFQSPSDVWKAYRGLEQKYSDRTTPGENATPEMIASWRKEWGIPETPAGYYDKLPEGLVVGDEDKKLVDMFAEAMHGKHTSPESFGAMLSTYYKLQEVVNAEQAEKDANARVSTEDTLRAEWGPDYRRNLTAVSNWLDATFDTDAKAQIANARLMDGTPLFSNPIIVQGLLRTALEANPAATIVPGAGVSAGPNIDTRIAELNKMMGDHRSAYWKGSNAEKLQAEYRTLVEAKAKMDQKAA